MLRKELITSVFLHGGISHLIFNSIALLAFGNLVEQIFGKRNFLIIYFCSGISGSALSVTFNSNVVSVGSSGAIFGMLGGLIVYYFYVRKINSIYAKGNLYGLGFMLLFVCESPTIRILVFSKGSFCFLMIQKLIV